MIALDYIITLLYPLWMFPVKAWQDCCRFERDMKTIADAIEKAGTDNA